MTDTDAVARGAANIVDRRCGQSDELAEMQRDVVGERSAAGPVERLGSEPLGLLVSDPNLQLTVLVGDDALARPLGSVITTDLRDPRRYLRAGALVLTGLMWHRGPADSQAFVEALAEYDIVALCAGEAALGSIPDDLVRACREHGVPLLGVPVEVAFSLISERVAQGQQAERDLVRTTVFDRQRRLLAAVAEGKGLGALLQIVADQVDVRCRVLTPSGREVASLGPPLADTDLDALTRTFLLEDRLPTVVGTRGGVHSVLAVGSRFSHRVISWFLACAADWREWPDDVRSMIDALANAIALERSRLADGSRVERRIAEEIVALVAAGHATRAETAARMRDLGVDPAGRFVLAVAAFTGRPDLLDVARAVLADVAMHSTPRPMAGAHDALAVTLRAASGGESAETARSALRRLEPGLGQARLAVGLSTIASLAALTGALEEARHAQRLAALRGEAVGVVTAEEVTSHVTLLGAVPDDVRRTFAMRALGGVLGHDERHSGSLLTTLQAFLDADGSWSRCAAALHVHVNSVRYRIGRVEELTGRDLSRLEDRVDLFLALRSLPDPPA